MNKFYTLSMISLLDVNYASIKLFCFFLKGKKKVRFTKILLVTYYTQPDSRR